MSSCYGIFKLCKKADDETTFLIKNGGVLLEKLITSCNGKRNPIRNFTAKELKIATRNYSVETIACGYGFRFYNGSLLNRSISVMKFEDDPMNHYGRHQKGFKNMVSDAYERCFNNIVFASQMSHKNVLKLIGCCLETQIPILVFESVQDYNLSYRMEVLCVAFPLRHRFKVAMEIANAIAYLHVGFPRPIIFRIIKPTKILFDECGAAKLSDFSECVVIPDGETHVKDATLIGTDGILSPEYVNTGYWDEKCDVYSFGVLILVLFTGESLYRFNHHKTGELPEIQEYIDELYPLGTGEDYLKELKKHMESSRLVEVMDQKFVYDESYPAKEQQLQAFAELGLMCVSESPENRPTMVEVAKQLRQLYLSC